MICRPRWRRVVSGRATALRACDQDVPEPQSYTVAGLGSCRARGAGSEVRASRVCPATAGPAVPAGLAPRIPATQYPHSSAPV